MSRLAELYEVAGPRMGCALVEAHVVLVLADLRGSTNVLLFELTEAARATLTRLADTLAVLSLRAEMMGERHNANGCLCSAVVFESLAGYAYVSRQTRMLAFPPFDPASGWSGWHAWAKEVYARLKASYPEASKELLLNWWTGMVLGYPDQAIEDACQWIRAGRRWDSLIDADLPAVALYKGAEPVFSVAPGHARDPGMVETIAIWNALLEVVYASAWHPHLRADSTFQGARHECEEQRRWVRNASPS